MKIKAFLFGFLVLWSMLLAVPAETPEDRGAMGLSQAPESAWMSSPVSFIPGLIPTMRTVRCWPLFPAGRARGQRTFLRLGGMAGRTFSERSCLKRWE